MPTTQSTQYAAQVAAAASAASRIDDSRQLSGEIQYAFIDVPILADNAATNVITLIELPAGAIIYPELSKIVVSDDMTSGALTIDIGDSVDPDRYCDGANCASTGEVSFLAPAFPAAYTTRHKLDAVAGTNIITATLATFTATIEAGAFRVVLAYKSL